MKKEKYTRGGLLGGGKERVFMYVKGKDVYMEKERGGGGGGGRGMVQDGHYNISIIRDLCIKVIMLVAQKKICCNIFIHTKKQ